MGPWDLASGTPVHGLTDTFYYTTLETTPHNLWVYTASLDKPYRHLVVVSPNLPIPHFSIPAGATRIPPHGFPGVLQSSPQFSSWWHRIPSHPPCTVSVGHWAIMFHLGPLGHIPRWPPFPALLAAGPHSRVPHLFHRSLTLRFPWGNFPSHYPRTGWRKPGTLDPRVPSLGSSLLHPTGSRHVFHLGGGQNSPGFSSLCPTQNLRSLKGPGVPFCHSRPLGGGFLSPKKGTPFVLAGESPRGAPPGIGVP